MACEGEGKGVTGWTVYWSAELRNAIASSSRALELELWLGCTRGAVERVFGLGVLH